MAAQLAHYVSLNDETGKTHTFAPGDDVPAWAKDQLGDHLFEEPEADPEDSAEEAAKVAALDREAQIAAAAAAEAEDDADPADEVESAAADEAPAPAETPAVDFTKPAPRVRTKK